VKQLGQRRADRAGLDQLVVLLAYAAAGHRPAGPGRAQQGVARGVLALDELHHVDAVPLHPQQARAHGVGQRVGEPLAQDAVAGEHGVRRGRRVLAQLGGDVVVAAGCGQHERRAPLDGAGQRVVGRGVAGVEGQHDVRGRVERDVRDPAHHELGVHPEPRRERGVAVRRLLLHVDADDGDGQVAHVGEVPLGREREVPVAAAEVGHPQRLVRRRPAQVALLDGVGDRGVEDAQELLDLAILRLPAGLHPALVVGETERDEHRVVLGQQPPLVPVVVPPGLDLPLAVRGVQQRVALLGDPHLVRLGDGVDVPVAERLVEEGVHGVTGVVAGIVVGGVRLPVVVRRDLQPAAGLQVDVPELHPAPAWRLGPSPAAGGDSADQRVRVEDLLAQLGEHAEQGLGRHQGFTSRERRSRRSGAAPRARPG
jgi:hypothetical protein